MVNMDGLGLDASNLFADISQNADIVASDAQSMANGLNSAPTTLTAVARECDAMAVTAHQFDLLQGSDWGRWRSSEFIAATDKLGRTISAELANLADLVGRLARPTSRGTAGDLVIVWNEVTLKKHVETLKASRISLEFLLECVPEHDACSRKLSRVEIDLVSPALVNLGNRLRLSMRSPATSPTSISGPSLRRALADNDQFRAERRLTRVRSMPETRVRALSGRVDGRGGGGRAMDAGKTQRRARQFCQLLHLAIEKRSGSSVLELLEQQVDPTTPLPGSAISPIQRALRLGDEYIVTLLAAAGADIEEIDETGATALLQGVRNGFSDKFIALMCEMGANVNAVDNLGGTALHIAAASDREDLCIGLLIDSGASTDVTDVQRLTPLAMAVVGQKYYAVERLVEHGADMEHQAGSPGGRTVLHMAIASRDADMVRRLCELGAHLDSGFGDCTALTFAIGIGALDIAGLLIESGADVNQQTRGGNFALLAAVSAGSEALTRSLLQRSAAVWMASTADRYCPLHMAAEKDRPDLIRLLVKKGSQVDPVTNQGETPLSMAVRSGNAASINCLVGLGADVNHAILPMPSVASSNSSNSSNSSSGVIAVVPSWDQTMLWLALRDGNTDLAKTLIAAGADAGAVATDHEGQETTPLHFASARGPDDLVRCMVVDAGAPVEARVWPGHSPLFAAARAGRSSTVRLLLEAGGAHIHGETSAGETVLFAAPAATTRTKGAKGPADAALVKYLVGRGARVNHRDHHGATALHHAGLHGNYASAKLLLRHGARSLHANAVYDCLDDFRQATRYRQGTPAGVARQKGHFKVAKLIDGWKYKS